MKKFNLVVPVMSDVSRYEGILQSTRIYHTIVIRQSNKSFTHATVRLLQQHGSQLRHFKFSKAHVPHARELFDCTPLLETLELIDVALNPIEKDNPHQRITLPVLKHMKFFSTEPTEDYLDNFEDVTALESFNLNVTEVVDRDMIIRFLMKQAKLTTLTIGCHMDDNFFTANDLTAFPFKLKKLNLEADIIKPKASQESFEGFMRAHRKTLTMLKIEQEISTDFYEIVLKQLNHLTNLEIHVTNLPNEKSFFCCLSPLTTVRCLKLQGRFKRHDIAKMFFSLFPAVTDLDCAHLRTVKWFSKFLKTIAGFQKNLEHLTVSNFFEGTPDTQLFMKIKSINVGKISKALHWKKFVMCHSTVESITVEEFDQGKLTACEIEDILRLPHLHHICFIGRHKGLKEVFDVIKKDYKKLRVADFAFGRQTIFRDPLKIYFPEDKRLWRPEEHENFFNVAS